MSTKDSQDFAYPPHPHYGYPYPPHYGYGHPMMPPYYGHPPHPAHHQAPPSGHPHGQFAHPAHSHHPAHDSHGPHQPDPMELQAQAMLEGMMGEQAGLFKDLMGKLGVDDKEFWKGAMIGAAAALILSNENVRGSLMQLLTGAGDMLKTGGSKLKEGTCQAASKVSSSASMSSEVFRDTVRAGKEGFKDSVERHRNEEQPEAESKESSDEQ